MTSMPFAMLFARRFAAITVFLSTFACDPASPPPNAPTTDPPKMSSADAGAPSSNGGAPTSHTKTLFIKESYADCEGEGPMKCLQIREKESDPWTLHYSAIDGFKYEEGYTYEIIVSTETKANPPQDAPSRRYHLVEIVSKQKVK